METTNTIGGPMQGTSINNSRRKFNLKDKKKKKKLKTMMEVTRNAKKNT